MQGVSKRYKIETVAKVSWLNLHLHIPQKDVRKIIYGKLDCYDKIMVKLAHISKRIRTTPLDAIIIDHCAKKGYLSILKWIHGLGYFFSEDVTADATLYGHFDVLKWFIEIGCCWMNVVTSSSAAKGGYLDILEWLVNNGCPLNEYCCFYAAKYGHLHILKWLFNNAARWHEWNTTICHVAADNGHLHVLEWAVDASCPFNVAGCLRTKHKNVIEWINNKKIL